MYRLTLREETPTGPLIPHVLADGDQKAHDETRKRELRNEDWRSPADLPSHPMPWLDDWSSRRASDLAEMEYELTTPKTNA
jgi:hypothetical protein